MSCGLPNWGGIRATIAVETGQIIKSKTTLWQVGAIAVIAGLFRTPIWLERIHQTFDEGVYLASNDLVANGLQPFRDVFSSQGPLFLPMLRASQWVSFEDPRGARTLMVMAAIGFAVGFYFVARAFVTPVQALLLSLMVATSGVGVLAAGPIQSDGLALAFGIGAIAFLLAGRQTWHPFAAGVFLGAALAVKSLHVFPIVLVVVAVLVTRRFWKDIVSSVAATLGTVLLVSVPFGLDRVWDQYVLFHLAKDNTLDVIENVSDGARALWGLDPGVVVLSAALLVSMLIKSRRGAHETPRPGGPRWLPPMWLAATVLLLAVFTPVGPGFSRALVFLIPPLLLTTAAISRVWIPVLVVLVVAAASWQLATFDLARGFGASPEKQAIVAVLGQLPAEAYVVSDDPGIIWASGRLSHPSTVDPSYARFDTGYLTPADVDRALDDPQTCAFVATSGRFEARPIVIPADYAATGLPGVFLRNDC